MSRSMASFLGFCTSAKGVSAIAVPAYLVTIGLGSKLSKWLTPPFMKSQMTLFAFGVKCGRPVGGDPLTSSPNTSRCNIQEFHLRGCEGLALVLRRHSLVRIGGCDPFHDEALAWVALLNRRAIRASFERRRHGVEPQRLLLFERPVASIATLLQ